MLSFLRPKHSVVINPSIVVFTTFFLLGLYFLYYIRTIVILLFLSFVIMTALRPGVLFLHNRLRLPRALAILLMYTFLVSGIALAIGVIVPPLATELQTLINNTQLAPVLEPLQAELRNFKFTIREVTELVQSFGSSVNTAISIAGSAFNILFTFFTMLVLSFYLLVDRDNLYKRVAWFTKEPKHLKMAKDLVERVEEQLGGWVRGQLVLMILIGVITYIALSLMGIPYALPLALLAGLLEILPNLGPTISAIPGILIALVAQGPVSAGVVTLFYVLIQQLENNLIVPRIMKASVDVSPLATILTILVGLQVAGVIGALLSVPVYIIVRTLYGMWREQH